MLKRAFEFEKFGDEIAVEIDKHAIRINDYGDRFIKVCLRGDK